MRTHFNILLLVLIVVPQALFAQVNSNPFVNPNDSGGHLIDANTKDPGSPVNNSGQNTTHDATQNSDLYNSKSQSTYDNTQDVYVGEQKVVDKQSTAGQCDRSYKTYRELLNYFSCVINNSLIQIASSLALIYFLWGVVQYVLSADNIEERKRSKQVMLWGIITMFVIVSVWGIVKLFKTTLGF